MSTTAWKPKNLTNFPKKFEIRILTCDEDMHLYDDIGDALSLGVCRIVIFAESEYSVKYTLPNPNILPNIRHCRIMKKICFIKRVFNADVQSSE